MRFDVITLFPDLFEPFLQQGVTRRAYASGQVDVRLWPLRDHAEDNYRRVDDRPYGGGPGMVMLVEPLERAMIERLDHGCTAEDFLAAWRWDDWNDFHIRVTGQLPVISVNINGLAVAQLDTARLEAPNYDPAAVAALLGSRGHVALEVHDTDAILGERRWGRDARCRWRDIRIRELG